LLAKLNRAAESSAEQRRGLKSFVLPRIGRKDANKQKEQETPHFQHKRKMLKRRGTPQNSDWYSFVAAILLVKAAQPAFSRLRLPEEMAASPLRAQLTSTTR
jgi:hypothetical protein